MTVPEVVALVRPPSQIVYLRVRPETALKRLGPMRMARPLLESPRSACRAQASFRGAEGRLRDSRSRR